MADQQHMWLFHMAQRTLWEEVKKSGTTYYPPTYAADGFTHATANPAFLIRVANRFYTDVPGEWVCLRFSAQTLKAAGIEVTFEHTAPVGEKPALVMSEYGNELFLHVQGGIPTTAVVVQELRIDRDSQGNFLSIEGAKEEPPATDLPSSSRSKFASGAVVGAAVALVAVVSFVALRKHS